MEKLRISHIKDRNTSKKVRIATSFLVASTALISTAQVEGRTPHVYAPVPITELQPLIPMDTQGNTRDLIITVPQPVPEAKKLTETQIKIEQLSVQRDYFLDIATRSGRFSDKDLTSLRIYLPIYIAAGNKFGVDWIDLWVNHEKESGASAQGSKAFNGSTYPYVGGMQLNTLIWTPDYIQNAISGGKENLEYLISAFPTRYKGDVGQIVAAAEMIGANEDKGGVRAGFIRFTGSRQMGDQRFALYEQKRAIFENQIKEDKSREPILPRAKVF